MGTRIRNHVRSNVVGYIAIFLFAMSGTAIALDGSNTVFSDDIVNGQVKSADIGNRQVQGIDVKDETLTSLDIADQSVTINDFDWHPLNLATGTGNAASCNDDDGIGTACVSTTVNMGGIGPITIHATGTWDTFKFNDAAGANSGSDNPNLVQGKCNLRFDGIQVGPVQELGEADVSGAGTPDPSLRFRGNRGVDGPHHPTWRQRDSHARPVLQGDRRRHRFPQPRHHGSGFDRVSAGGRSVAERDRVLRARGPLRRQDPADEIAALVSVHAGARIEQRRVAVAVHRQQARATELLRHRDRSP